MAGPVPSTIFIRVSRRVNASSIALVGRSSRRRALRSNACPIGLMNAEARAPTAAEVIIVVREGLSIVESVHLNILPQPRRLSPCGTLQYGTYPVAACCHWLPICGGRQNPVQAPPLSHRRFDRGSIEIRSSYTPRHPLRSHALPRRLAPQNKESLPRSLLNNRYNFYGSGHTTNTRAHSGAHRDRFLIWQGCRARTRAKRAQYSEGAFALFASRPVFWCPQWVGFE